MAAPKPANLIRQIAFNDAGIGTSIFAVEKLQEGHFIVPVAMTSDLALRYRVGDNGPEDAYPGLTDDDVIAVLAASEAASALAIANTKRMSKKMTPLEFYGMFTDAELGAIYTAASLDVRAKVYLDKTQMAQDITLTDPRTIGGILGLVALKLLTQPRADDILAGKLPPA